MMKLFSKANGRKEIFGGKVAVVTGGVSGIGKTIAEEFIKNGVAVCVIDKRPTVRGSADGEKKGYTWRARISCRDSIPCAL